jgi:hypothetical protein
MKTRAMRMKKRATRTKERATRMKKRTMSMKERVKKTKKKLPLQNVRPRKSGILNVRQRKVRPQNIRQGYFGTKCLKYIKKINILMIFRHLDCYVIYVVWGNIILGKVRLKLSRTPIHYLSVQQVSVAKSEAAFLLLVVDNGSWY